MNKIFLVTYPDVYHSDCYKIALINITSDEKYQIQEWLKNTNRDIVVYLYDNTNQIDWLLNVINQVDSVYINVDNSKDLSYHYISYMLGKSKIIWANSKVDYSNINKGQVRDINGFLERE